MFWLLLNSQHTVLVINDPECLVSVQKSYTLDQASLTYECQQFAQWFRVQNDVGSFMQISE